ncbi:MAG: hypothetical protein JSV96_00785 [Candidatus Aminicenantes bacterium]|nr:MAG: hypothetical protein JSV96_00785 [Candidatus Aminicenantes bacterium]
MRSQIYEPIIGPEINVQLLTKTKLFCAYSTQCGSLPNSLTCPVCLELLGALPQINKEVKLKCKNFLSVKS